MGRKGPGDTCLLQSRPRCLCQRSHHLEPSRAERRCLWRLRPRRSHVESDGRASEGVGKGRREAGGEGRGRSWDSRQAHGGVSSQADTAGSIRVLAPVGRVRNMPRSLSSCSGMFCDTHRSVRSANCDVQTLFILTDQNTRSPARSLSSREQSLKSCDHFEFASYSPQFCQYS